MSSQNSGARRVGQKEVKKLEENNAICPNFHRVCIKAGDFCLKKIKLPLSLPARSLL